MKRKINFMEVPVTVVYDPDSDMVNDGMCSWCLCHGTFSIIVKHISLEVIAHECWHLFMRMMQWMDGEGKHTFEEMSHEIYAWNFGSLYALVADALRSMEKAYDKKGKD